MRLLPQRRLVRRRLYLRTISLSISPKFPYFIQKRTGPPKKKTATRKGEYSQNKAQPHAPPSRQPGSSHYRPPSHSHSPAAAPAVDRTFPDRGLLSDP